MNQFPPGAHQFGPGGWPPPGPGDQGRKPGPGRTLAWLGLGLVLVLAVIGAVFFIVRGGDDSASKDDSSSQAGEGAKGSSCGVYQDVVLNDEMWAATKVDPDKVQEMYDAVRADITDEEIAKLVEEEATTVVSYYRALGEWKQSMEDAMSRGEYGDTTVPDDFATKQADIARKRGAVLAACEDSFDHVKDGPRPEITSRPLVSPSGMGEN